MNHGPLLYYITFLQIADIATTGYLLNIPGHLEANPIMRWSIKQLGLWPGLILPKAVIVALLFIAPTVSWILYALSAFYTAVVVNNSYLAYQTYRGNKK